MTGGMPGMRWLWQGTLPGSPTYGYSIYLAEEKNLFIQTSSGLPSGTVQHALERNLQLQFPEAFRQPAEEQWKASEILILETIIIFTLR